MHDCPYPSQRRKEGLARFLDLLGRRRKKSLLPYSPRLPRRFAISLPSKIENRIYRFDIPTRPKADSARRVIVFIGSVVCRNRLKSLEQRVPRRFTVVHKERVKIRAL